MTATVVTLVAATVIASGTCSRYNPDIMEKVVNARTGYGQIDPAIPNKGYVALLDCEHLGRQVWLQQNDRIDGPYLVADCAAAQHRQAMRQSGRAVELSWKLAQEWGVIDDLGRDFLVWDGDPSEPLPVAGPRPI